MPYKVKLFNGPAHNEVATVRELRPIDVGVHDPLCSFLRTPAAAEITTFRIGRYGWPQRYAHQEAQFCAFYEGER